MARKNIGGWWRLWIVMSALWAGVIAYIAIDSKPDFSMPDEETLWNEVSPEAQKLALFGELRALAGGDHQDKEYITTETPSGYPLILPANASQGQIRHVVNEYEAAISELRPYTKDQYMLRMLFIAASLPLAMLIAAITARWIWRGFKDIAAD